LRAGASDESAQGVFFINVSNESRGNNDFRNNYVPNRQDEFKLAVIGDGRFFELSCLRSETSLTGEHDQRFLRFAQNDSMIKDEKTHSPRFPMVVRKWVNVQRRPS